MKKIGAIIFLLLILSACLSNGGQKEEFSEAELGEAVFYEIFPTVMDSIHFDSRLIPPPPPPEYFETLDPNIKFEEKFEKWKKSDVFKKWLIKKDSLERDTTTIYLIVQDSISLTSDEDQTELLKYIGHHNMLTDSLVLSNSFKLNLSKLESNQRKMKFLYSSNFPEGREFRKTDYDIYIAASLGFTKIIFDKTKRFGVLNAGYVMGPLNGYGKRIFIRKDKDGKWVVDKVESTWIS